MILPVEATIPCVLLTEVKYTHGEKAGMEHLALWMSRLISSDHRKSYSKIMLVMLRKLFMLSMCQLERSIPRSLTATEMYYPLEITNKVS